MKNILNKKLGRKGFTLAELLIVVAIIAILVAIALPLFFGALDNAKKARDDAEIRAVKAIAVNEILNDWEKYKDGLNNGWKVTADVSASGDVSGLQIIPKQKAMTDSDVDKCDEQGDGFKVTVFITEVKVDTTAGG